MCPNMTRIFPPASARRPTGLHSNNGSDSTLDNRGGFVKINLKLVRQCLLNGSASEKTAILDAIRMVSFVFTKARFHLSVNYF